MPVSTAHGGYRAAAGGRTSARWGGPLPPAPTLRQAAPAAMLRELAAQLRLYGLDHLYGTVTTTEGVLSVAWGLTVWTNGHTLRCHTPTGTIYLPASTSAAARHLAGLTRNATARQQDGTPGLARGRYPTSHGYPPPPASLCPATMTPPAISLPCTATAAQPGAWMPGSGPRVVSLAPVWLRGPRRGGAAPAKAEIPDPSRAWARAGW